VTPFRGNTVMKVNIFLWLSLQKHWTKDHLEGGEKVRVVTMTKKVITF